MSLWEKPPIKALTSFITTVTEWKCSLCHGSGIVFARKADEETGPFIFRCTCYRGKNDKRRYASWDSVKGSEYVREGGE